MQYRPSTTWVDRANQRGKQMERIQQAQAEQPKKRSCLKHPTAYWGNDQWGNPYTRCVYGNKLNENCEEVKE